MPGMFFQVLCLFQHISLDLFSLGSAETYIRWGGKMSGHLMASCFKNISTTNYQNPIIGFQVTVKNVGDFFWDTVYIGLQLPALAPTTCSLHKMYPLETGHHVYLQPSFLDVRVGLHIIFIIMDSMALRKLITSPVTTKVRFFLQLPPY